MLGFKLNHVSKRVPWYLKLLISGCLHVVKAIKHVYNESATFCESYSMSANINGPLNLTEAVTVIGTEDHLTLGIADLIKSAAMEKLMPFPPKSTQSCCNLWYHREAAFFFLFHPAQLCVHTDCFTVSSYLLAIMAVQRTFSHLGEQKKSPLVWWAYYASQLT